MIFDTSTAVQILKYKDFFEKIKGQIDEEVKITSITVYELLRGATYLKIARQSERELNVILSFISELEVVPLGRDEAKIASYIWGKLKSKGTPVSDADILIASICVANKQKLLTIDEDFKKIKDVYDDFEVEFLIP